MGGMISKVKYDYKMNGNEVSKVDILQNDLKHQQTGGKSLCYFKVDPVSLQYGIAINYWCGSIDVFSMTKDGKIEKLYKHIDTMQLSQSLQTAQETKSNQRRLVKNREDHWKHRQCGPHAHSVHFYKKWVFIPDLGENCIFQFGWDPENGVMMEFEAQIKLKEGAGPRHMVFHPHLKCCYVSNELNSSISVLKIDDTESDKIKCRLKCIQDVDTDKDMAEEQDIWKKNYVAEIGMSKDGKFIYCSNRGYDTIAIFKILLDQNGILEPVSFASTFGKTPRHFAITPDNKYLIGANQDSNNLVVFKRNLEKGTLELVQKYTDKELGNIGFAAPNFVLFTPLNDKENKVKSKVINSNGLFLLLICVVAAVLFKFLSF